MHLGQSGGERESGIGVWKKEVRIWTPESVIKFG